MYLWIHFDHLNDHPYFKYNKKIQNYSHFLLTSKTYYFSHHHPFFFTRFFACHIFDSSHLKFTIETMLQNSSTRSLYLHQNFYLI